MTNRQAAGESDLGRDEDDMEQPAQVELPGISGDRDVEPQSEPRPDNDGETVSE